MLAATILIGVAAPSQSAVADRLFELRPKPTLNKAWRTSTVMTFTYNGVDCQLSYIDSHRTTKVRPDGSYEIRTSTGAGRFEAGPRIQELPAQPPRTYLYQLDGTSTQLGGPKATDPNRARLDAMNSMIFPKEKVKVGSRWQRTWAANRTLGTRPIRGDYRLAALEQKEGRQLLRLASEVKETTGPDPILYRTTSWVDPSTMQPIVTDVEFQNMPFPGFPEPISGFIKVRKVD